MRTNGFTLIEMVMVIIILSVIVTLAMVGFRDTMSQQVEHQIIMDLKAIQTAIRMYATHSGEYDVCGAGCATAQLNAGLGLHIAPPENVTYRCFWTGSDNRCRGEYSEGATYWEVTYWPGGAGQDPYCSNGVCPTCKATGCHFL